MKVSKQFVYDPSTNFLEKKKLVLEQLFLLEKLQKNVNQEKLPHITAL